jgi:hypothetical protein
LTNDAGYDILIVWEKTRPGPVVGTAGTLKEDYRNERNT